MTRILRVVPATVPSQDLVSGAATTDGLVTLTVRDRPCARPLPLPLPCDPSLRAGLASRTGAWDHGGPTAASC